jgi:thioredoxin-related protein
MSRYLLIAVLFLSQIVGAQNWLTDFDKAKEQAKKENKSIVMVFSGSDWCAPCIKLDKDFGNLRLSKNMLKTIL